MRRGFILTLLSLVLFLMLVQAAVQVRTERLKSSGWAQTMMADRKILYASDDIAEDVKFAYGVRVVRSGSMLTFYDTLPANYSVDRSLRGYNDFVQDIYRTPDLGFQFYDDTGNLISLDQMPFELVVYPYNLTYHYLDFGKRVLEIYCAPSGPCEGTDINWVGFGYEFQNANFTWIPEPGNESYYNWAPNFLGDCEGDPNCINFTFTITDSQGYVFKCPSEMCNYTQFTSGEKSTLDVHMTPCWFEIRLGDDNIATLRLHEPNNPNVLCNAVVDATTTINFSSSEYYLNLPGSVRVTDVNYNFTRIFALPGENLSGREIGGELPPANGTEAACFAYDADGVYAGGSASKYIYGLKIGNSCPAQNITIDQMMVSWLPDSNEKLEIVNINGTLVWVYNGQGTPDGWQHSGVMLDIVDFKLPETTTVDVNYLRFQQGMNGKTLSIKFVFADGTTVTVPAST